MFPVQDLLACGNDYVSGALKIGQDVFHLEYTMKTWVLQCM